MRSMATMLDNFAFMALFGGYTKPVESYGLCFDNLENANEGLKRILLNPSVDVNPRNLTSKHPYLMEWIDAINTNKQNGYTLIATRPRTKLSTKMTEQELLKFLRVDDLVTKKHIPICIL